jgi:hypothetical protein
MVLIIFLLAFFFSAAATFLGELSLPQARQTLSFLFSSVPQYLQYINSSFLPLFGQMIAPFYHRFDKKARIIIIYLQIPSFSCPQQEKPGFSQATLANSGKK